MSNNKTPKKKNTSGEAITFALQPCGFQSFLDLPAAVDRTTMRAIQAISAVEFFTKESEWKAAVKNGRANFILPTRLGGLMRAKRMELSQSNNRTRTPLDDQIFSVLDWAVQVPKNPDKVQPTFLPDLMVVVRSLCGDNIVYLSIFANYLLEKVFLPKIAVTSYRRTFQLMGWDLTKMTDNKDEFKIRLLASILGIDEDLAASWVRVYNNSKDPKIKQPPPPPDDIKNLIEPLKSLYCPTERKTTEAVLNVLTAIDTGSSGTITGIPASASASDGDVPKLFCSLLENNTISNRRRIVEALAPLYPDYDFHEAELQYERGVLGDNDTVLYWPNAKDIEGRLRTVSPATVVLSTNLGNTGSSGVVASEEPLFGFASQVQNPLIRKLIQDYVDDELDDRNPALKETLAHYLQAPLIQDMTPHEKARFGLLWSLADLCIFDFIDAGSSGCVFLAYVFDNPECVVAVKIQIVKGEEFVHDVVVPLNCHSLVDHHPNIVQLFGYFVEAIKSNLFLVGYMMELCDGNLESTRENKEIELEKLGGRDALSFDEKKKFIHWVSEKIRQAGAGLAKLHTLKVAHRDFKPQNVLEGYDGLLKLTDFGLAREHEAGNMTKGPGSIPYMAPEVDTSDNYSTPVDVWSWGALLFELITGDVPNKVLLKKDIATKLPVDDDDWKPLVDLCKRMLCEDPAERTTAEEALKILDEILAGMV